MKKIYISGKITGIEEKAEKIFEATEHSLKTKYPDAEIINPIKLPHNHDKTWESYMREDIGALVKCDAICVLDNWRSSRGARLEVIIAKELKIKFVRAINKK